MKMYERVSRVKIPRFRGMKKTINGQLRKGEGQVEGISRSITVEEVLDALRDIDGSKSAGPDGVNPKFLKNLPRNAIEVVTRLFQESWRTGWIPQSWKVGEIIPLLKPGKEASKLESYRPVCLTSCMGKWMERVLNRRLRWWIEDKCKISQYQTGFRQGRGVEDQVVRLSQEVWDGFQERKKSGLVLFDFERAYDKVWRDALLYKMCKMEVHCRMIRWIQAWLTNRLAWVRVNDTRGRKVVF